MLRVLAKGANSLSSADFGRRFSAVALVFTLITGALVATYSASRPMLSSEAALALYATAIVVSILIAQLFFDLEGWYEQRRRDIKANEIFNQITHSDDASEVEPFILYLRPFASTDQLAVQKSNVVSIRPGPSAGVQFAGTIERIEFEEDIEKALRPLGHLIGLGRPLEHMGAGRIQVEDDVWKDGIKRLIDHAKCIVMLPSSNGGTSWEVDYILSSGFVRKTIVVDPPNDRSSKDVEYDPVAEWAGVKDAFLRHGYVLPEDDPDGQLLIFGEGTQPIKSSKIGLGGENKIRSFAKALMRELKAKQYWK